MNQFRFEHLKNRRRQRLPRPILYVGVAIILLAFFSIKWFQRADEAGQISPGTLLETAPAVVVDQRAPAAGPAAPADRPEAGVAGPAPEGAADDSGGILSLDGSGQRILPPRRISGQRPVIPAALLRGEPLERPRVYVRVGEDGLVTDLKLVSSSGNGEVDRLVLDALGDYTFHPAMSLGQPVAYSSVVTVPLRPAADNSP